jgi:RNA polymerase sigma-70 factor, ECF subfamily
LGSPAYLFAVSRQCRFVDRPPTEPSAEGDLVREARRGKEQAFLAVYYRHRSAVFQFAWRLTGSRSAAEDITQECFLALVCGAAFDSARGSLRTYLFGIVRNLAMRHFRISEREAEETADSAAPIDVLGDIIAAERSSHVAEAVAQLPILQREAIILFTFEELSLEEIAKTAGVDVSVIKARLHRARESLRKALSRLLTSECERRCS